MPWRTVHSILASRSASWKSLGCLTLAQAARFIGRPRFSIIYTLVIRRLRIIGINFITWQQIRGKPNAAMHYPCPREQNIHSEWLVKFRRRFRATKTQPIDHAKLPARSCQQFPHPKPRVMDIHGRTCTSRGDLVPLRHRKNLLDFQLYQLLQLPYFIRCSSMASQKTCYLYYLLSLFFLEIFLS